MPARITKKRRITKPPSARQMAARKKFIAMVRARAKASKKKAVKSPRRRNKTIITKPRKVVVMNKLRNSGSWKDSKVTWAVSKMMEMAEAGDVRGIDRFNDKAYEDWAKGSNDRKDELKRGYNRAIARAEDVRKQKNSAKSKRRKYRNGYLDLVIKGHAKKTPSGWSLGGKTFKQGKGIVPASRAGYYLDLGTGTVFSKKARNVAQGAYYGGNFHPYRDSSDYDPVAAGETGGKPRHTRSKKKRAAVKKAIRTATDKAETRRRKSTTSRLAGRSLRGSGGILKKGRRNPMSQAEHLRWIERLEKQLRANLNRIPDYEAAMDAYKADGDRRGYEEEKRQYIRLREENQKIRQAIADHKKALGQRNPSVKSIRKEFAGTVGKASQVFAPIGTPKNVAKLGKLLSIETETASIKPSGVVYLCADSKGKLHLCGSKDAPLYNGPAQSFGKVKKIEYETAKPHLYPGQGTIQFWHKLGEEDGRKPTLIGDGKGGLCFRGGNYKLTREGIVN